jgi:putative hydrolase of the HAD superfamily
VSVLSVPDRGDIDAVVFDAGGVLLLPDAEAGRAAIATLDCESTTEDWRRAHYATLPLLDQMQTIDWLAHHRAMAALMGVPDERLDAAAALIEDVMTGSAWVAVPGAADALRALSGAGYQLAVVSNAWGTVAQWLEQHGICSVEAGDLPQVATVIDSHLVGIEKPDPRIFQLAIDVLGVPPERSLYIGDSVRFDVNGAFGAGLHPVHVDPYDLCDGSHRHVAGLGELTSWLVDGETPRVREGDGHDNRAGSMTLS